ncbi:MAG: hypothetical protein ACLSVD_08570 [Eggerthellaceae bacterium]
MCEHCGAPMVIVTTARGPWKLCPNFDCPGKEQKEDEKGAKGAKGRRPRSRRRRLPEEARGEESPGQARARREEGSGESAEGVKKPSAWPAEKTQRRAKRYNHAKYDQRARRAITCPR